ILIFSNINAQGKFATIALKSGNTLTAYDGSNTDEPAKKIRRKARSSTSSNIGFVTLDGDKLLYFTAEGEIEKLEIEDINTGTIDSETYHDLQVTIKRLPTKQITQPYKLIRN
ncbi:MAG: hypothetical protein JKY22_01465, partial [Flavobacteriaceae bacterium]|nr:hypothetical protein [Flavobacteriaceae bacterium]